MSHWCRTCGGKGYITCTRCGGDKKIQGSTCYACDGKGVQVCPVCKGEKYIKD